MGPADGVTPSGWPVFVVWQKGKGRVVVDLRGLNDQVVKDSYPLPMQQDIIGVVSGKDFISIFDLPMMGHETRTLEASGYHTSWTRDIKCCLHGFRQQSVAYAEIHGQETRTSQAIRTMLYR